MAWVTRHEAAAHYNIALSTLRERARKGTVKRRHSDGAYLYWVDIDTPDEEIEEFDSMDTQPVLPPITAPTYVKNVRSTESVYSWYDVHVPDHSVSAVSVALSCLKDRQPKHFIIGGDFLELESCSSHGGVASPAKFTSEIEAGRALLEVIRNTIPNARIMYLEGNHENRLHRSTISNMPSMTGAVTVPGQLDLKSLDIGWLPYKDLHRVKLSSGNYTEMAYTHGSWHNRHHAAKAIDVYQMPIRYGHTHRPQLVCTRRIDGHMMYGVGTGCMRTLHAAYMATPTGWCQGFGIDEYAPDGRVWPRNVLINQGTIVDGGQVWSYE